jgi:hypothetical protein
MFRRHSAVLILPGSRHLRGALRALRHIAEREVALVIPAKIESLAAIPDLEQLLAWARDAEKDVTIITSNAEVRAEAVALGVRAATSVAAWQTWQRATHDADREAEEIWSNREAFTGWRIIHPPPFPQDDDMPAYVAAIGAEYGLPLVVPEEIPADEMYETALFALLCETGGIEGRMPFASSE